MLCWIFIFLWSIRHLGWHWMEGSRNFYSCFSKEGLWLVAKVHWNCFYCFHLIHQRDLSILQSPYFFIPPFYPLKIEVTALWPCWENSSFYCWWTYFVRISQSWAEVSWWYWWYFQCWNIILFWVILLFDFQSSKNFKEQKSLDIVLPSVLLFGYRYLPFIKSEAKLCSKGCLFARWVFNWPCSF